MKNLLIAQSGGPTAAINATLGGILQEAVQRHKIDMVYGALHGIQGVLTEDFVDLSDQVPDSEAMELLCQTPAAALGSCRYKLSDAEEGEEELLKIIEIFRKHEIRYFLYIGGNDSMDTVDKLSKYCRINGITDLHIMGAPKTIDNDLMETDHCPGFGSAAKYIATTFAELERDVSVYNTESVTIVEVMGRNAGWLTAASALSRINGGKGPSLIYLCEKAFDAERFIEDVKKKIEEHGPVLVAISEGIQDKDGNYISDEMQAAGADVFGHQYIAGAGRVLENLVRTRIGCKVRSVELNLMQRAAAHIASETDLEESKMLGRKALSAALEGRSGEMAAIHRKSSTPYEIEYITVPVEKVANHEKTVPSSYINENGNDVTEEMITYLKPLIQGEVAVKYKNGLPEYQIIS